MTFIIFDESFYLAHNPDVRSAVNSGDFSSGLEHFENFGLQEGRVLISPWYNERFYLQYNPDVAAAVAKGNFVSGLEHLIQFGMAEGRNPSLLFDESFYLQQNSDVAAAVASGNFASGLEHLIQFGIGEGRNPSVLFDEEFYLQQNPDVLAAVANGDFVSGLEHFAQFGMDEGRETNSFNETWYLNLGDTDVAKEVELGNFDSGLEHYFLIGQFENRLGLFTGTEGNDKIIGFGLHSRLYGIDIPGTFNESIAGIDVNSVGVGERDTLIGGEGEDEFVLGFLNGAKFFGPWPYRLYLGNGEEDFALIQNFNPAEDTLQLEGEANDYLFAASGDRLSILYAPVISGSGDIERETVDLVGIVDGVTSLDDIDEALVFVKSPFF